MASPVGPKNQLGSFVVIGLLIVFALHVTSAASAQFIFMQRRSDESFSSETPSLLFSRILIMRVCKTVEPNPTPLKENSTEVNSDITNSTEMKFEVQCVHHLMLLPPSVDDQNEKASYSADGTQKSSIPIPNQQKSSSEIHYPREIVYKYIERGPTFNWIHISIITIVVSLCIAILVATFMMNRKIKQVDASRKARTVLARMVAANRITSNNNNYTTAP